MCNSAPHTLSCPYTAPLPDSAQHHTRTHSFLNFIHNLSHFHFFRQHHSFQTAPQFPGCRECRYNRCANFYRTNKYNNKTYKKTNKTTQQICQFCSFYNFCKDVQLLRREIDSKFVVCRPKWMTGLSQELDCRWIRCGQSVARVNPRAPG